MTMVMWRTWWASQPADSKNPLVSNAVFYAGSVEWEDRYGNEPRKGADILVQALEREGVGRIFAYPGGASMEIHQALTRSPTIRNILCRHEQVIMQGNLTTSTNAM